jgi:hypothetical protein
MKCPVCAYPDMPYPPADYNICPCCGTEFGNDDAILSFDNLRNQWINNGAHWFYGEPPQGWNPYFQLIAGNLPYPTSQVSVSTAPMENTVVTFVRQDHPELVAA